MEQYAFDYDFYEEQSDLYNLNKELKSKIFGQDHVIDELVNTLKINFAGLGDEDKPLGSFLFLGSTGIGKTQLAIELAKSLDMNFERFDMSEHYSKNSKSTLIGSEAGLIGYEEGGLLTNAILENPKSVILFDEIEKAHESVMQLFLQVMDYGILTNTKGVKVRFDETIIIFTSNLGANTKKNVGFGISSQRNKENEINEFLAPEFRARLDVMIEFNALDIQMVTNIVNKFLTELSSKLNKKNIFLDISEYTIKHLIDLGFNQKQGARGISKTINSKIKPILSNEILFGKLKNGGEVYLDVSDENFIFDFNSTSRFIDEINDDIYRFDCFEKASNYAKANPGFILTNDPYGNGYIVKETSEEF